MKRYNITTVRTYEKDGQEKKTYPQIGKLIHFPAGNGKDESFIIELSMYPNTRFCVFPDQPRDQRDAPRQRSAPAQSSGEPIDPDTIEYPSDVDDINPDDIPF